MGYQVIPKPFHAIPMGHSASLAVIPNNPQRNWTPSWTRSATAPNCSTGRNEDTHNLVKSSLSRDFVEAPRSVRATENAAETVGPRACVQFGQIRDAGPPSRMTYDPLKSLDSLVIQASRPT